jgi:hypothetical protein
MKPWNGYSFERRFKTDEGGYTEWETTPVTRVHAMLRDNYADNILAFNEMLAGGICKTNFAEYRAVKEE